MMLSTLCLLLGATPVTLDEVRAASRHQLDAVRAQLDVDRAASNKKSAVSAILPQVNLGRGHFDFLRRPSAALQHRAGSKCRWHHWLCPTGRRTPSFTQGNFQLALTVSQLIYDGGRWWNQIAQAGARQEAALGQLQEQQLSSELEGVRRFYELVRAQMNLKILQSTVDRSETQLDRAKSLFEAGRVQRRDVLDADINVGNDRIAVLRQNQTIVGAQSDLLQWIARPSTEVEAVVPNSVSQPLTRKDIDPAAVLEKAKQHRPLFKTLDAQIRASQLTVAVARADYLPRVSGQLQYVRQGPSVDPFFTDVTRQNSLSAGLSLSWDLFSGFATDSNVERARADVAQSNVQEEQAVFDLQAEIRRGIKTLQTQESIVEIAQANTNSAHAQVKLENDRYSAGAGSTIEVRNAELKLLSAELTLVQSRIDVEVARAALVRSVGTELETP